MKQGRGEEVGATNVFNSAANLSIRLGAVERVEPLFVRPASAFCLSAQIMSASSSVMAGNGGKCGGERGIGQLLVVGSSCQQES